MTEPTGGEPPTPLRGATVEQAGAKTWPFEGKDLRGEAP
jgi:hypothetical protein